jgi:hypothetical protein
MHPWTIPILGVVALSLAVPSRAEARLRFGPGVVLGAVAGAMFGGFRHSFRYHHRRHAVHASARPHRVARWERRPVASPEVSAPPPPTNPPSQLSASPEQTAAIFWPDIVTRETLALHYCYTIVTRETLASAICCIIVTRETLSRNE